MVTSNNVWANELMTQIAEHPDADLFVNVNNSEYQVTDVVYDPTEDCIEIVTASE